jgi:hypothetical protein
VSEGQEEDPRLETINASTRASVDSELLKRAAPRVARAIERSCRLRLIP